MKEQKEPAREKLYRVTQFSSCSTAKTPLTVNFTTFFRVSPPLLPLHPHPHRHLVPLLNIEVAPYSGDFLSSFLSLSLKTSLTNVFASCTRAKKVNWASHCEIENIFPSQVSSANLESLELGSQV